MEQIEPLQERYIYRLPFGQDATLCISLTNKGPNDTVVVDGQITEDLLMIVETLRIDSIDLTNKLSKISLYRGADGTVYRTNNYITFNGDYRIKIHHNILYTEWLAGILN